MRVRERETERVCVRERMSGFVYHKDKTRKSVFVCVKERERVYVSDEKCVCITEMKRVGVCVCVCV
jgi:hypothetical protein